MTIPISFVDQKTKFGEKLFLLFSDRQVSDRQKGGHDQEGHLRQDRARNWKDPFEAGNSENASVILEIHNHLRIKTKQHTLLFFNLLIGSLIYYYLTFVLFLFQNSRSKYDPDLEQKFCIGCCKSVGKIFYHRRIN